MTSQKEPQKTQKAKSKQVVRKKTHLSYKYADIYLT